MITNKTRALQAKRQRNVVFFIVDVANVVLLSRFLLFELVENQAQVGQVSHFFLGQALR